MRKRILRQPRHRGKVRHRRARAGGDSLARRLTPYRAIIVLSVIDVILVAAMLYTAYEKRILFWG